MSLRGRGSRPAAGGWGKAQLGSTRWGAGGSRRLDSGKAGTLLPSPTQMALAMPAWASQPAFQGRRALSPGPPSLLVRRHHGEAPTGPAVFGQHRLEGLLLALGPRPRHVGVWAGGRAWGILGLGTSEEGGARTSAALPSAGALQRFLLQPCRRAAAIPVCRQGN